MNDNIVIYSGRWLVQLCHTEKWTQTFFIYANLMYIVKMKDLGYFPV